MRIHEYQARELFAAAGIPVLPGDVAASADEAREIASRLGCRVVIKAQVHVGGRGKAGGVKLADTPDEAGRLAGEILKLTIKGLPVRKVLVAPAAEIATEVYLSLLLDRDKRVMTFIGCAEGGIEIEETARTAPEKIKRLEVAEEALGELTAAHCRPLADQLFSDPGQQQAAADLMARMAHVFAGHDASLVEINPLVVTAEGQVLALDAKVLLDDNAAGRHPDHEALRDMDAEDADELEAKAAGLSFIRLDGDIGCMVNGAGLAMATMDIIKHYGGQPANFLDVGGSSSPDKVVKAFQIILKDPQVKVILVNIFGGITRCDDIARGILAAKEQFDVPVPVVVRLVGTNETEGRALLAGTELTPAVTLDEGARTAIELAGAA